LPNFIAPKKVNEALKQLRVTANITQKKNVKKERLPDAEYISDPYDLAENQKRLENKSNKEKNISTQPFIPTTVSKCEKSKDLAGKIDPLMEYVESPYDALKKKEAQEKWIERLNFLHGEFKSAPKERHLKNINRSLLPDILNRVRLTLTQDWPEAALMIYCKLYLRL